MSVGDDAAVASRVVRQAVPEAKAVLCGRNSFRIFHSCDAVRLHQLDVPRFAASQKELHELGQFAWRSLHIAGRAQVDVLVSNGARRIALVALRERGAIRVGEPEIADSDLQRRKNPLLDIRVEGLAGDLLDHVARDAITGI